MIQFKIEAETKRAAAKRSVQGWEIGACWAGGRAAARWWGASGPVKGPWHLRHDGLEGTGWMTAGREVECLPQPSLARGVKCWVQQGSKGVRMHQGTPGSARGPARHPGHGTPSALGRGLNATATSILYPQPPHGPRALPGANMGRAVCPRQEPAPQHRAVRGVQRGRRHCIARASPERACGRDTQTSVLWATRGWTAAERSSHRPRLPSRGWPGLRFWPARLSQSAPLFPVCVC